MSKYTCKKSKDEILAAIVEEFERTSHEYDDALQGNNEALQTRNHGRYIAMFDLLHKLEVYER